MNTRMEITLRVGQVVPFDKATDGWAQINELLRTNVELAYKRDGKLCHCRRPAFEVAQLTQRRPLLFGVDNMLGLAIATAREKTFKIPGEKYGFQKQRPARRARPIGDVDDAGSFPRLAGTK